MKGTGFVSAGLLVMTGLLSGCQSVVQNAAVQANESSVTQRVVEQREARLAALDSYAFSGGLGIWTDNESISARMNWQQFPDSLQIDLSGPLGLGDMRLSDSGMQAVLTRGNRTVASGKSADIVLQQGLELAAPVPLQQLGFWVRGLPGKGTAIKRDTAGKLVSLRFLDQQGTRWQARFKKYTEFNGLSVPALITASGGPYSVRVLLKNWQTASGSVVPEVQESNKRLPIPDG